MSDDAYKQFIEHMNSWIYGFPDSKYLLPMLKMRITPEEAELLSKIPFLPHTIEQLSNRLELPQDQLMEELNKFARKGIAFRAVGRTAIRYSLRDSLFMFYRMPGWKGEEKEWDNKLAPLLNNYYTEAYGEVFLGHPTKGLRTVPINKTIENNTKIMPYEEIVKIIENFEYYTVATCACRQRRRLDPKYEDNCKHETENCLHFDLLGKYKVQNGIGREITKEETLEILKRAADAGLIHGVSNSLEKMDTICNCCSCCCLFFEKLAKFPEIIGHERSNFIRKIDEEKCITCGLCVKNCAMGALELKDDSISFNPKLCLGCGACVHKCPENALILVRREDERSYPRDQREQVSLLLKERGIDHVEVFKKNAPQY